MANQTTYTKIHTVENMEVVKSLEDAKPTSYVALVDGSKPGGQMDLRLDKTVKLYVNDPES